MKRINHNSSAFLIIISIIIASLMVSSSGCTKKEDKEIRIGAILPLTGGASKYGEDAKAGIELAVEQKNAVGGIHKKLIQIIFEDDQSSPQQSVASFKKLIEINKVPVVIGGMTSSSALAIAPIAEQNKIVLLTPSASAPALSKAGDYIFRNELSDAYGGVAQAELTWNKLGIKRVAIIYINNDYGVGVKDAFVKTFEKLGGRIMRTESFDPDTQDFRAQLTRIKQKSPEAIFIVAYKESIIILRQIKELGLKAKLLSTPVFEDKEIIEKSGGAAEGVIYVYYGGFNPQSSEENIRTFLEAYRKRNDRDPGYYSALAYDAAMIVFLSIEKAGTRSEDIKKSLYEIKDFPGVTGMTTFDLNGDVTKSVALKIVKNGKFGLYYSNGNK